MKRLRFRFERLESRDCPSGSVWLPVGPQPAIPLTSQGQGPVVAGRIDVAVADPTDPNVVYVGGASGGGPAGGGGIWKTTNFLTASDPQGPTWVPLIDDMPSLSIFAKSLTISPSNPNILYAAAQGPNGCILKTIDGGQHWSPLGQDKFANAEFGAIVVNPTNPNVVYVAVRGSLPGGTLPGGEGVYESTDGGATWNNITAGPIGEGGATDLVIGPTGQVLYAGIVSKADGALNGVYQSLDGGASWSLMTSGINHGDAAGTGATDYIRLTMAPGSNSNVVYAMMFLPTGTSAAPDTAVRFRTTAGNDTNPTWTKLSALPGSDGTDVRFWHMVLAVDPNNPDVVYTNGDEPILVGSTDGGQTWSQHIISGEDVVNIYFDDPPASANPSPVMLVGDRGIQFSTDAFASIGTSNFVGKRGNLGNFLVYNTAADRNNPRNLFSVSQDQLADLRHLPHGLTWKYLSNVVNGKVQPLGNELGRMIVNPRNSRVVYSFRQLTEANPAAAGMLIEVSTDGGKTWTPIVKGLDTEQFPSAADGSGVGQTDYNAFVVDPNNTNHVLVGAQGVWEATFRKDLSKITWTQINDQIVDPDGEGQGKPAQVCALAVARGHANIVYAATTDGKVWRINRTSGAGWQLASGGLPTPVGQPVPVVQSISVDPKHPNHVFINTGSVFFGTGRVWETRDGGQSWSPIGGDLPAGLSVHSVAVDWHRKSPVLYAGTDRGVYQSVDGGTSWTVFGTGLPNTMVNEVALLSRSGVLTASTYGRSVWQTSTRSSRHR